MYIVLIKESFLSLNMLQNCKCFIKKVVTNLDFIIQISKSLDDLNFIIKIFTKILQSYKNVLHKSVASIG